MTQKFYTNIGVMTDSMVQFYGTSDADYVSLKAPSGQASNFNLTLPGSDTTSGAWVSDGSGNISISLLANANIATAAAIAVNKLAALTVSRAVVSDGSGFLTAATTTAAEIGFVNGVTSSIQTQLNGKASTALSNLTVTSMAAGDLLYATSGSALVRLPIGASATYLTSNGSVPSWATIAQASFFNSTWATADTATKAITHSLGTLDVIVQVYDISSGDTIMVDVTRTSTSVVTVAASEAPPATSWRVMIMAA